MTIAKAGTVKDQTIEFVVSADVQRTRVDLKYTGTIEGRDSMKGKLSPGEFGVGTFTGKLNSYRNLRAGLDGRHENRRRFPRAPTEREVRTQ